MAILGIVALVGCDAAPRALEEPPRARAQEPPSAPPEAPAPPAAPEAPATRQEPPRPARTVPIAAPASHPDRPAGAPAGVVHVPGHASRRPWLVVFLHGWRGCARALVAAAPTPCADGLPPDDGWDLAAAHDAAGTDSLLVVPQLAWRARDGSPGRFAEDGFAARWLRAAAEAVPRDVGLAPDVGARAPVILAAHSAGFETAHAILAHGGLGDRVRGVVLFDALYAREDDFGAWLAGAPERRRLLAWYASDRAPFRNGKALLDQLRRRLGRDRVHRHRRGPLGDALATRSYVLAFAPDRHADVPRRRLAPSLVALGRAPDGPPRRTDARR